MEESVLNQKNSIDGAKTSKVVERQLVVFNIDKEEFGVNINEVNSIIKMEHITKIPNSQHFIEGVINLRGKIIVVVNLAKKLGLPVKEHDKFTRIMVIESSNSMIGMIVDQAREAIRLSDSQIEPAPPLIAQKINSEYLEGVGIVGDRLLILLDLAKVLGDNEMSTVARVESQAKSMPKEQKEVSEDNSPKVEPTKTTETTETTKTAEKTNNSSAQVSEQKEEEKSTQTQDVSSTSQDNLDSETKEATKVSTDSN